MTPAVCRLLFVCFFCTLWGGQVIAAPDGNEKSDVFQVVFDALVLQVQVDLWQGCVVRNATELLSSLQQAELQISQGEEAVKKITDGDDLRDKTQNLFDKIKKEITAANGSATTLKNEAEKFLKDIDDAYERTTNREKFQELFNKKKMDEFKEAALLAAQVWDPIHEQAKTQIKSAEEASSHTAQANSTAESDSKFLEGEENKDKLENVKNAVSDAKTALVTAAKYASEMEGAAKEVQKKLGEMLQTFRNAAGLAARPHEEGAKNEGGKNEKGDTGAGKENGTTESTLRQTGEKKSSSVDGSLSTTSFLSTFFVPFVFGPVAAAIAAA